MNISDEVLDWLNGSASTQDDLFGTGRIIKELSKPLMERMLETEMPHQLGYKKHAREGNNTGNSRNGKIQKTVKTGGGDITIKVPRDRNAEFEALRISKRQTTLDRLNKQVLSLYAKGMTVRDIKEHVSELYGTESSGLAFKQIRNGESVIDAPLNAKFESSSGFCDAFSNLMGAPPSSTKKQRQILQASCLDTPLGPMVAIASEDALYLLEFVDRRELERKVERLGQRTKSAIIPGTNAPIVSIEQELKAWFDGTLKTFKTPLFLLGSPFQKSVWEALCLIPYGETRSYLQQATMLCSPSACRAVANANGANQIAIVIPCHRIINSNGELGGYGGGIVRKQWLIAHEKQYCLRK